MNLTLAELTELPLPAAVLDRDDQMIAHTPEWRGAGPGSVSYPVRSSRLVVTVEPAGQECETLLDRLLAALAAMISGAPERQARRIAMLAGSLRVVAGAPLPSEGSADDVIDHALAGISVRTGVDVRVEPGTAWRVRGPEVAALVLVQLAANAERHDRVSEVTISHAAGTFDVRWRGGTHPVAITTTRQHRRRTGWGLGFARIAADTLGGAVYPPQPQRDGTVVATLELGLRRLTLPLAMVRDDRVVKATRSWDEETGHHPATAPTPGSRLSETIAAARAARGAVTTGDGFWARAIDNRVWVAVPPDGVMERARDVLDGIGHERALWDGVPEPERSRVFALASLLSAQLGTPLPRVPAHAWNRSCAQLCSAFGVAEEVPELAGIGALDPRIVAYLAVEFGRGFHARGETIDLRLRADRLDDPVLRALRPDGAMLRLT